jgi:hypothetical protein
MFDWLRKPYPFLYERLTVRLWVALFVAVFVFVFLVAFKPFNIDTDMRVNMYMAALFYGITSGATVLIAGSLLILLFPNIFKDKEWTVGKEMICTNLILISATISNAFLGYYMECVPEMAGLKGFWLSLYLAFIRTYAVGIFPVTVLTAISYSIFLKRNLTKALENNKKLDARPETKDPEVADKIVTIVSPSNNNDFSFRLNDLLFIMADGNYVEFHMESENTVKREIKRNTLRHIESQLSEHDFLFRSHRAYLVNLKKVIHSSGNAQGYELKLSKTDHTVPVSRRNLERFDTLIKPQ